MQFFQQFYHLSATMIATYQETFIYQNSVVEVGHSQWKAYSIMYTRVDKPHKNKKYNMPFFGYVDNPKWIRGMYFRADSRFAPIQWETSLQSNVVSHWLGANLEWAL